MKDIIKFWSLPRREKVLVLEAGIWLSLSSLSVKTVAFNRIDTILNGCWNNVARANTGSAEEIRLIKLSLSRVASRLPWKSTCLNQSIAGFIMLRRRGIPAVMYLGVKFSENSSFLAHAWVQAMGEEIALEPEDSTYTPMIAIGQKPNNFA
jgi:hypothetical protein